MTDVPPGRTLADAAEMLWVVLANVSGGDWTQQSAEWQEAAARWRDNYFEAVKADRLRSVAPQAFTEHETKDVLTALYQDGHVDLVLADRVAALMQGRAADDD